MIYAVAEPCRVINYARELSHCDLGGFPKGQTPVCGGPRFPLSFHNGHAGVSGLGTGDGGVVGGGGEGGAPWGAAREARAARAARRAARAARGTIYCTVYCTV